MALVLALKWDSGKVKRNSRHQGPTLQLGNYPNVRAPDGCSSGMQSWGLTWYGPRGSGPRDRRWQD